MKIQFDPTAFDDYSTWATVDKKIYKKLNNLIKATLRDPFNGIGKPEPLKHELSGCWSRRITDEHRLVYMIEGDVLYILSCKNHY